MSALLVEERWRAEARYRAALEGKPGAPRLHTFRADANGNRVVLLDGDQIGYVANSGGGLNVPVGGQSAVGIIAGSAHIIESVKSYDIDQIPRSAKHQNASFGVWT